MSRAFSGYDSSVVSMSHTHEFVALSSEHLTRLPPVILISTNKAFRLARVRDSEVVLVFTRVVLVLTLAERHDTFCLHIVAGQPIEKPSTNRKKIRSVLHRRQVEIDTSIASAAHPQLRKWLQLACIDLLWRHFETPGIDILRLEVALDVCANAGKLTPVS